MEATFKTSYEGTEYSTLLDLSGMTSIDEARAAIVDAEGLEIDPDDLIIESIESDEIPDAYCTPEPGTIDEYLEAVDKHGDEIVFAAAYLGIPLEDIDEAYHGEYDSDEAFARDIADQIGSFDKNQSWPHNCIDWEYAAKELMYDYAEYNNHYFRNL